MDDPCAMRRVEGGCDLNRGPERLLERESTLPETIGQRLAVQVLHHQVMHHPLP